MLLEGCYRFQVIDFYKNELNLLNTLPEDNKNKVTLIFGDSFTAHPKSYIQKLRDYYPDQQFINTAIPGTGIYQHSVIANKRINDFKPDHILYQFYVGNDFTDVSHPVNYSTNSILRNIYWVVSDQLIFIQYLNSKLAKFNWNHQKVTLFRSKEFNREIYNNRVKIYFKASPSHLGNTIQLKGDQKEIYQKWKLHFNNFLSTVPKDTKVSFLIIPQCAQVSKGYQERMELIGAQFNQSMQSINYPLIQQIKIDFPEMEIINPLGYLKTLDAMGKRIYYENDPHFTLPAQELLGNYLINGDYFE